MSTHKFSAKTRSEIGSNASKKIRRNAGLPAVLYGTGIEPTPLTLSHHQIFHLMQDESFHSAILDMELDGKVQQVIIRDYQYHPYKPKFMHIDFQKVSAKQEINMTVPLHFLNAEESPGVKLRHGIPSQVIIEIGITCMPKDLPPFIEVDMGELDVGDSIHARDIKLPTGVTLSLTAEDDPMVCSILAPMKEEVEEAPAPAEEEEGEEEDTETKEDDKE